MKIKVLLENKYYKWLIHYVFGSHLEEGEKVHYVVHRHPWVMKKDLGMIILFMEVLPVFLWWLFPEGWFFWLIWVLVGVLKVAMVLFKWFLDVILVTSKSLIDVKWNGLFNRDSARLEYSMIEGTSYNLKGVIRTILNFGNLKIEGTGGATVIELFDAIDPPKSEAIILKYQQKYLSNKNKNDAEAIKNLLAEVISQYVQK